MNYRIEEKEAFSVVGIKERFSYTDNLGKSVGEMYPDNTTDYYIGVITTNYCPAEFVKLDIQAQTWAILEIVRASPTAMSIHRHRKLNGIQMAI